MRINVSKRVEKPFYQNRKLPRVEVKVEVKDNKEKLHTMVDFNFKYCTLEEVEPAEEITFLIGDKEKVSLKCQKVRNKTENRVLYQVMNYDEICRNKNMNRIVEKWIQRVWKSDAEADDFLETVETEKEATFDEMNYV